MKNKYILLALMIMIASGCAKRNLVYFSDLTAKGELTSKVINDGMPKILKNDILGITVNSTSPESNVMFASTPQLAGINGYYEKEGYRVNKDGNIKFPVIGEIKLEGLNLVEAQALLESNISRFVNNCIVTIKYMNFRVTVIGEVNKPSTFIVPNEKINLLEALGLAGDMTAYGKRDNVLIIRENDGKRIMARVNLNHQSVINSEYFNIKQNDVIYVEPDKIKALQFSNSSRTMPIIVAMISAVVVVGTTLLK